jgi:Autotransporter beta-domain
MIFTSKPCYARGLQPSAAVRFDRALRNTASATILALSILCFSAAQSDARADEGNFYTMLRDAAGVDNLFTPQEFFALIPPEAQGGPPQAELDAFVAALAETGGTDADGNIKIENLVARVVALDTLDAFSRVTAHKTTPITLSDINLALPSGIAPDKVKDFLISLERGPGGSITKEAAEAAIMRFVAIERNTGNGEQYKHVAPLFGFDPNAPMPIRAEGFGSSPVEVTNAENIFAFFPYPQPAIRAASGAGGCQWNEATQELNCVPPGNGGSVVVTNSGTLFSVSDFDPSSPYINSVANTIDASSIGGPVSVFNSGFIVSIGDEAAGIAVQSYSNYANQGATPSSGNVIVENSGIIQSEGDSTAGIAADTETGSVQVKNSGAIFARGKDAVGIEAETGGYTYVDGAYVPFQDGGVSIKNSGQIEISGNGGAGISTYTPIGNNTIENTGRVVVDGNNAVAIRAGTDNGSVSVKSSGDVVAAGADSYGIIVVGINEGGAVGGETPSTAKLVVNIDGGTVQGGSGARSLGFAPDPESDNNDEISTGSAGVLFLGGKDNLFSNKGTVSALNGLAVSAFDGAITFSDWDCSDNGCQQIISTITIAAASLNAANLEGGKILGDIVTGSGNDIVSNRGEITGNIALGNGTNKVTNNAASKIVGNISAGTGNDVVDNVGDLKGNVTLGDGSNRVTNSTPAAFTGNITTETGDDEVKNAGALTGSIALGGGLNKLTNGSTGKIAGNVTTGAGDDVIDNRGELAGNLTLGDGKNSVANAVGAKLTGAITVGLGDDDIKNAGTITGNVGLGAGLNALTNSVGGTLVGDVTADAGNDTFANSGTFAGNVNLGAGTNSLTNLADGVFQSADTLNVGAGNTITNAGIFNPGGLGRTQTTVIVGNFVQSVDGRLLIDIKDVGDTLVSDRLNITGAATLAGIVVPNVVSIRDAAKNEYLIVSTTGVSTNDGLNVAPKTITVQDTIAYDFEVDVRDNNAVYLTATQQAVERIVEAAAGATNSGSQENLASLGRTLMSVEDLTGTTTLKPVLQALRVESSTPEAAAKALNRLTPQQQSGQTNSTNTSGTAFSNAMLSCASRDQPYKFSREDTCYYAKFTARKLDRDATATSAGHEERGYEVMGGAQVNLGGNLRGGIAFGYEDTSGDTFSNTQKLGKSEGDRVHAGIVLKNQWGPINAYLNIAGSFGSYDHTRFVNLGGFTNALGEQDVVSGLVKLRLSYLNDMGSWYVKPMVDVGATYVDLDGYSETGAGAFNLRIASHSDWLFSVSPAIEIGGEIADGSGTLYRPFIRGGVTVFDKDDMTTSANFAGAPVGVAGFTVKSELDNVFGEVAAGVQVLTSSGVNMKLEYEGRFGEHTTQNAGTIKVTLPY